MAGTYSQMHIQIVFAVNKIYRGFAALEWRRIPFTGCFTSGYLYLIRSGFLVLIRN
jgi:hypothetical protein